MSDDLVKRLRDQTILERFENGYVSQIRNPDGPEAAIRIEKLEAALRRCDELFSDIRNDWSDPRSECREGWSVIKEALEGKDD